MNYPTILKPVLNDPPIPHRALRMDGLSIVLVLTAMVFTPVSYIAPAREMSILFAPLLGTRLLAESHSRQRVISACVIILGVIGLSLG